MSVTNSNGYPEVFQAFILDDPEKVRHGCLFGLIDNDRTKDVMTSPIKSYVIAVDNSYVDVTTKSKNTYRVIEPDSDFIATLISLVG